MIRLEYDSHKWFLLVYLYLQSRLGMDHGRSANGLILEDEVL
jgi:hypothetical protein